MGLLLANLLFKCLNVCHASDEARRGSIHSQPGSADGPSERKMCAQGLASNDHPARIKL
jgi:hypothetical protein